MGIIYMAINNKTGKVYVGLTTKSLEERKRKHIDNAQRRPDCYFWRSIQKHGSAVFDWLELESLPDDELKESERFWISYFKSIGLELYNTTNGGESPAHSLETRAKISAALIGHEVSEQARNKIKIARKYQDNSKLGYIKTTEQLNSHSLKVRKVRVFNVVSPAGEIYIDIPNLSQFCRDHGLTVTKMSAVLNGRCMSHRGYRRYNMENSEI